MDNRWCTFHMIIVKITLSVDNNQDQQMSYGQTDFMIMVIESQCFLYCILIVKVENDRIILTSLNWCIYRRMNVETYPNCRKALLWKSKSFQS